MIACLTASCAPIQNDDGHKDPRVIVESEDQPERLLLETKIQKEDGFQKQQGKAHHSPAFDECMN